MENLIKLNLGCGVIAPDGWINIDCSWSARLAKIPLYRRFKNGIRKRNAGWSGSVVISDLRKPLPFGSNEASAVYASHLLEHLYLDEANALLKECFRVLKPSGILRLVVPDLRNWALEYLGEKKFVRANRPEKWEILPADRFNTRLWFAPPYRSKNLFRRVYDLLTQVQYHKWMYDAESLGYYMKAAGFHNVKEMGLHESRISDIVGVEDPGRVENGEGLCMEGEKPA